MNRFLPTVMLAVLAAVASGCEAESAPRGPERVCAKACEVRVPRCSAHDCTHGCGIVIDRFVEHEGDTVVRCMAERDRCDDRAWAACATRIGVHADGGPPAPAPPRDDEDVE